MNFTRRNFQQTSGKFDTFMEMVKKLTDGDLRAGTSPEVGEDFAEGLIRVFEERMSDDLDVKGAFDGLYEKLTSLVALRVNGKANRLDCERATRALKKIDQVLQVIETRT